jgi:hypothetical protein
VLPADEKIERFVIERNRIEALPGFAQRPGDR